MVELNEVEELSGDVIEETETPQDNLEPEKLFPDDTTIVNLVSKFDNEEQATIVDEIIRDYDFDLDSRKEWETKRDKWYKLWACIRDAKNYPWPGASNVCIPMLSTASNQFHARAYQSIFSAPELVKTIPVSSNDKAKADRVKKFLNWQIQYDMEEYEEVFDKTLQLLPINGIAFKKVFYCPVKKRPISEYIPALDLVLPYKTKSLETARRITHRIYLHYDEMIDRDDDGLYENFDNVSEAAEIEEKEELTQTSEEAVGETSMNDQESEPHLILETHKKYKIPGEDKREPLVFTVDRTSRVLLRVTRRSVKKGKEVILLNHFIDYHFIPNPDGFYSFGFGHFLETLNEMANTAFNQIFDAGRLSNNPFGFYGRRSGIKKREISLTPGKMTEVEDAKQVFFPSMQRVDNVLFSVLGVIDKYTETFTSASEYLSGRESKGTKTPTASGTLAIIEQGLVTFAVLTKRVYRAHRKELRLIMKLNQLFIPDAEEARILGTGEDVAFPDIKAEDFAAVKDVIATGDPSFSSRGMKVQEAMQMYEVGMSNPLVIGTHPGEGGEGGQPPNIPAMHALYSDVLDAFGVMDKSRILPPLPEQPIDPIEENMMFMQGDYKSPIPGEDHDAHIQVHLNFMEGNFFAIIPDNYKKLVNKHLRETQQIKMSDQAQITELGGGNQGVNPAR